MAVATSIQHRAEQAAAALPPLLVEAERVAATVAQGVHGRRRVGQGETFWQFRAYEPGDPVQRIDWRESAKSQRVYVRETEWEAAQSVWLWRDRSPSMQFASDRSLPTKRGRADLLTLALAALLVRGGERIALLGAGWPPGGGRTTLNRVGLTMSRDGEEKGADLPAFEPLPRHAQLVLVGDLMSPLPDIHALVRRFAALGVAGHLLQVVDPIEEDLPFDGRVRFEGMEADGDVLISRVETVREAYVERLRHHRDGLSAIARATGWTFAIHRTDRPPHGALLALYAAMARLPGK